MRRLFMAGMITFITLFCASVYAQIGVLALPEPQAGKEYTILPTPVPTSEPNKIEVTEVFWYGCPHCYDLEPIINKWSKNLPADVHFVRMPALFSKLWNIHGQLFITLDTLKVEDKLHSAVFESIRQRKNLLLTPEDMADFVAQHGVDKAKFLETYNSFGVQARMEKDKKVLNKYGITGVPAIIVNGKYRIDFNDNVAEPADLMRVTNYLIEKERAALKPANDSSVTEKAAATAN
ncbi:thiol:disulfide interchange protein DsbA/DsbL [Entomomonas sp. E2T0]|uniref:thiol:disulfide interchange protein DsbA/DsbL n=1 Tax=Entomomonas sp. E2T0 TaxID=2930213 RepID=UPI0022284F2B|nr:thiol:disulfide interchange protein DsbA/DsbL [Entomomonas sp. E2T0]UYZ84568.1 thiol:disulfide interchange protein DsbA/DsbL [Entomomonas sp. E2T0]